MVQHFTLIILILSSTELLAAPSRDCINLLHSPVEVKRQTETAISYLDRLFNRRILTEKNLFDFLENLKKEKVINPVPESEAEEKSTKFIHWSALNEMLMGQPLDLEMLKTWTARAIKEAERAQSKRSEAEKQSQETHQKIELVPVEAGQFTYSDFASNVEFTITLTHPFEVMTTPFTQRQWSVLFGANPSKSVRGAEAKTEKIDDVEIVMKPDNPVENITWWSAIVAANKLSERAGLKPVYDLSRVTYKKGTESQGNLEMGLGEVIINAPDGDIYKAQGFRLPTAAEQLYLLHLEIQKNGYQNISRRAWPVATSNLNRTQPVGLLAPLNLSGRQIYDLFGNVWEYSHDGQAMSQLVGTDPLGPPSGNNFLAYGGQWHTLKSSILKPRLEMLEPNEISAALGFRLVRSLPQK